MFQKIKGGGEYDPDIKINFPLIWDSKIYRPDLENEVIMKPHVDVQSE